MYKYLKWIPVCSSNVHFAKGNVLKYGGLQLIHKGLHFNK